MLQSLRSALEKIHYYRGLLRGLLKARNNLIAVWPKKIYREKFVSVNMPWGPPVCIINEPEGVNRVMVKNSANYIKSTANSQILRPLLGNGLFVSEGALWKRQREIIAPSTHLNRLSSYANIIIEEGLAFRRTCQLLGEGTEIDAGKMFTLLTADIISRIMFGYRLEEDGITLYDAFCEYQASHGRVHISELLYIPSWVPRLSMLRARKAIKRFDGVLLKILATGQLPENAALPNLLQMLLAYRDDKGMPMSQDLILDEMASIFLAGHETTAITLSWAFYLLQQHPDVEQKLHAELDRVLQGRTPSFEDIPKLIYTRAVIDETLRLYPPVHVFARCAVGEDEIQGNRVHAGSFVIIASWILHRHELYWEQPEIFNPDRFLPENSGKIIPFSYIPFGAGPRICVGKHLGIMESVLLMAIIAQSFTLRLKTDTNIEPLGRMTLRPSQPVMMHLRKRQPPAMQG